MACVDAYNTKFRIRCLPKLSAIRDRRLSLERVHADCALRRCSSCDFTARLLTADCCFLCALGVIVFYDLLLQWPYAPQLVHALFWFQQL